MRENQAPFMTTEFSKAIMNKSRAKNKYIEYKKAGEQHFKKNLWKGGIMDNMKFGPQ